MEKHSTLVTELLTSWNPQSSDPILALRAMYEVQLTRRGFSDTLRSLGTIIEASLQTLQQQSPSGDLEKTTVVPHSLCIDIYDWEATEKWWSNHLDSCFPTWAQQRRLSMKLYTRESPPVVPLPSCFVLIP